MGRVIFQEGESGRIETEREDRRGKKEIGIERRETKMEREYKRERKRGSERDKD